MDKKQYEEMGDCLMNFVRRVANNPEASPAEVLALPEIARLLCEITSLLAM